MSREWLLSRCGAPQSAQCCRGFVRSPQPLILHRWMLAQARLKPELTFSLVEWLHRVLLFISLITVLGAVAGSHGLLLFE